MELVHNSLVRNFKNFKIVLSELSLNLAMIRVPDFFLTRLVGTRYWLDRRARQKANLMYKCINNLAPAYLCNLSLFSQGQEKINVPKTKNWLREA